MGIRHEMLERILRASSVVLTTPHLAIKDQVLSNIRNV